MQTSVTLNQGELKYFLLHVATECPVLVWGPPGIGKTAIVEAFAKEVDFECVSLCGSQMAPEDIGGAPKIIEDEGVTRFFPPSMIRRDKPYCLFIDEINACSQDVQKAFYSLIHEQRVGEYRLPAGSVVIGAGNRSQDSAIVKQISSALVNRMVHVHMTVSTREWLEWAGHEAVHPWVIEYIQNRPDHLWVKPPKTEEPFSTPRSWHMVSKCLKGFGSKITEEQVKQLAHGCLTPAHAVQFCSFVKLLNNKFGIAQILKGDASWPRKPSERDLLYFLAQSFRAHLMKTLPRDNVVQSGSEAKKLAHESKKILIDLANINFEIAQMVVSKGDDADDILPSWFMAEVIRDLPRLIYTGKGGDGK